ncbi:MARVEL-like domain protein [Metarhizium album ARSEF 1941]|uniref:MARVEL-like domain protein n=1 Tax=Metarhizium album (strain ARSEF 1941) TaxID=1081103 RepID=A0A0B2WXC7_METAS|nr:MARVEL-like domain protein [Metarhizium album ARSEF 1941]KHN98229.1 MARVEL-like domain protein [Metarhizium album ARSEF 1941]
MSQISSLLLRVLQAILAVANLGLSAYVIKWYRMSTSQSPDSSVNFLLAASILSILSILYLVLAPRFLNRFAHPYAALAVQGLNTCFYFAGFIALAVYVGSLTFCEGSVCRASRADAVVAAGAFCAWIASTILTAKQMIVGGAAARHRTQGHMGKI